MLEFEEYKIKLNNIRPILDDLGVALKLSDTEMEISELEKQTEQNGFWDDLENSQKVLKRTKQLKSKRDSFKKMHFFGNAKRSDAVATSLLLINV